MNRSPLPSQLCAHGHFLAPPQRFHLDPAEELPRSAQRKDLQVSLPSPRTSISFFYSSRSERPFHTGLLASSILNSVPGTLPIRENVPLGPFTTFNIGGPARFFITADTEADVEQAVAFAHDRSVALFILGGGSNLLVRDAGFNGLVLHIAIPGIDLVAPDTLDVGAGVSWDTLVDHAIALNLAGIECLAGIPGSTGGTPVQNVGAYGQ
jgi:hypothetical protein